MPNWAEGNIRLRGKRDNIIEFIRKELVGIFEEINVEGPDTCSRRSEERPVKVEERYSGDVLHITRDKDTLNYFYFRGSQRQFIFEDEPEFDVDFSEGNKRNVDNVVVLENFNGAWNIDEAYFKQKALEYKIDIRIFVYEAGMQWSEVVTYFRNGDTDQTTRSYSDWFWDSPMPHLGG